MVKPSITKRDIEKADVIFFGGRLLHFSYEGYEGDKIPNSTWSVIQQFEVGSDKHIGCKTDSQMRDFINKKMEVFDKEKESKYHVIIYDKYPHEVKHIIKSRKGIRKITVSNKII